MATKRPAILIPLPISFMDEQTKNAKVAKEWGVAKIIPQDVLTPEVLLKYIDETISNYTAIVGVIRQKESPDIGASGKLLRILRKYVK
jgi:UDP-N-acetylglucosamine:LPS N-acetylglucosamine transferase